MTLTLKIQDLLHPSINLHCKIASLHRILLKSPAKESHSFVAFGSGLGAVMNAVNDIMSWHLFLAYLEILTSFCVVSNFDFPKSKSSCTTLGTAFTCHPFRRTEVYILKNNDKNYPFRNSSPSKRADRGLFVFASGVAFGLLHGGSTELSTFTQPTQHNHLLRFLYL